MHFKWPFGTPLILTYAYKPACRRLPQNLWGHKQAML